MDPDRCSVVLNTAARHGDRTLFDRFRAQAKKESDENVRDSLLSAMGLFRDPAITNVALSIILTDEFDNRESLSILFNAASVAPDSRRLLHDFVKQNWGTPWSPSCPQTSAPFFHLLRELL